jgi:hypothetical protein
LIDKLTLELGQETNIIVKRVFNFRQKKPYSNCDLKEIKSDSFNSKLYKLIYEKSGKYNYKGIF